MADSEVRAALIPDDEKRLRRAARRLVRRTPGLRAIVLYGSRARGDCRQDSDWDLAFVVDGAGDMAAAKRTLHAALPEMKLQVLQLSLGELNRKANALGNVACPIAREGCLVAGAWERPNLLEEPTMKAEEYSSHVEWASGALNDAVRALAGLSDADRARRNVRKLIARSADAAEYLVKAMLGRIEGKFRRTRDLTELAGEFSGAELRAQVHALNNRTRIDHQAGYFVAPEEGDAGYASRRVALTLALLVQELDRAGAAMAEVMPGLLRTTAKDLTEAAEALRSADVPSDSAGGGGLRSEVLAALDEALPRLRSLGAGPVR